MQLVFIGVEISTTTESPVCFSPQPHLNTSKSCNSCALARFRVLRRRASYLKIEYAPRRVDLPSQLATKPSRNAPLTTHDRQSFSRLSTTQHNTTQARPVQRRPLVFPRTKSHCPLLTRRQGRQSLYCLTRSIRLRNRTTTRD